MVLWIALVGASGIDLLGGAGPFVLTPFLVLSPVLFVVELKAAAAEGWDVRVLDGSSSYVLSVLALLAVLSASTFLSYDLEASARRFALLLVQVCFVLLMGMALANRKDPRALLVRGAYAGLLVSFVFGATQVLVFLLDPSWAEPLGAFLFLHPADYFGVVPRLAGPAHDANLGGLIVVFYLALLLILDHPSGRRTAFVAMGSAFVLLTLSRSAILAGLALGGMLALRRRDVRLIPKAVGFAAAVLAVVTTVYLAFPGLFDGMTELSGLLRNRFTLEEGSTAEHALVLTRGWESGTGSVKQALLGIGYGNAFTVLQDVYPGNEHGNFHSLLLTLFAEAGVGAAILGLWIFARALVRGGEYQPLVAAMIGYDLFQQAHTTPVLWLSLLLAWVGMGVTRGEEGTSPRFTARHTEAREYSEGLPARAGAAR